MTALTHLLVANPMAQSGRNAARIDVALHLLRAAGLPARLLPTAPGGRTVQAVRDALTKEPYRCVIAMGGDGTFREVAEGLLESPRRDSAALGMLPAGTANNHGRSFGLRAGERALERNVRVLAAGRETRLDAGKLHAMDGAGRTVARATFFDSVGFGIGAAVIAARNVDRDRARRLGKAFALYRDEFVYAGALIRTLVASQNPDVDFVVNVVADDARFEARLTELLIRGTRVYAGGWVVDPTSRHDDGLFEVFPFPTRQDWLRRATVGLSIGPLARAGFVAPTAPPGTRRASRIDVHFRVPEGGAPPPCQLDGEEFPRAERASIEVIARALRLIVPDK
ncbi:diacylglycerol/lipid kinase family protein [Polyangium sorediatum]|uniref:Diacylglycerol kinase family protein n=1 Tax=Polyangium sorediatum TaxID=889274 RepID=A0ABT6NJH8_9BACT|nr:diacylglycerol kinase family protein [Polyangium sorediatum]MDI1428470.1 diacylglycerol kinase family protein [Polyangium sorediatum]